MPLLKKRPFQKTSIPENIHEDEEVFHCFITNEIFRDYEDFSERMFLCNSMVWTCSLTGKTNLTYVEALESEETANNTLKEFPAELKIPILYLASKTKRTAFSDMAEDVYIYAKDRFFIGENIETCFTGTKWKDSHVLQVISPSADEIKTSQKNGVLDDHRFQPLASLYKYEIEHLDANDTDISEIMIVDYNNMRRKKGTFSREKCKLFLKQYIEQNDMGIFVVKPSVIEAFNLNKVTFEQIFDGIAPEFNALKRINKDLNGKKMRQESLHKFLSKNSKFSKNGSAINFLEKARTKEEFKMIKQQKKEKKLEIRQKKKEENIRLAGYLRNWYQPKEDLELVDQQILPKASPVRVKVPDECIGDMLMVLEFVHTFSKFLPAKDFFPNGLTIELMERALTSNEVAGPLTDLIQMLLVALFTVQDQEASQYKIEAENPSNIKPEEVSDNINLQEATRLATNSSVWSKKHQGVPLGHLPLYSLTTSEVLRLHLLASGAVINNTGARWRYQQRGGYTSEDDPGLCLRLHSPHILKALKTQNVVELGVTDKLRILSCLINQLLTYADIRDIIEERTEQIKQAKNDYKLALAAEKRREQEFMTSRYKLKKLVKSDPNLVNELLKLETETDKKRAKNENKLEELRKASYDKQILMGQDRAFRQYLKLESVPGFFVNFEEENTGICLNNIIEQVPYLINANRNETVAHIKKTMQDSSSSDKENSPSKSIKKTNGVLNGLPEQKTNLCNELMLCSTDPETCIIHSANVVRERWCFYHEIDTLQQLIDALNKRGVRENELQRNIKNDKVELEKLILETPAYFLNPDIKSNEPTRIKKVNKSTYENANLGYPNSMNPGNVLHNALIENVLEMEEKINAGNLGSLSVNDREKWRFCLQNKNYKELDKTLTTRREDKNAEIKPMNCISDSPDFINPNPSLSCITNLVPDIDNNDVYLSQKETQDTIRSLSVALAQVARAVKPNFLKKPLGRMSTGRNKKQENVLPLWEQSLLMCTSFSQIFLHYSTLDSCVMWGKSVLLTRCRICRRRNDSENMLLCDSCNLGHHLYCLKPKLKNVPFGDWYCNRCQKERKLDEPVISQFYLKQRPVFSEEIDNEESEKEVQSDGDSNSKNVDMEEEKEDDGEEDINDKVYDGRVNLCKTCGSGGEVIGCEKCSCYYHIECVNPPLRRAPRGSWICISCKNHEEKKRHHDRSCVNDVMLQRTGKSNGQRRCAAQALYKIHDFVKILKELSDYDDSSEEEVITKRSSRRDEGRPDLPLHNSALHAVLAEIMKNYNAWPFLRPVQKNEVPDYYDVISKPMDFGTIKYKLNMGEYQEDAQFMSDALLVFQNCNTYNHTEDEVYKCGVELRKHFQQKCKELCLKVPEEIEYDSRPPKKIRTK